jgi:hypothetical protein
MKRALAIIGIFLFLIITAFGLFIYIDLEELEPDVVVKEVYSKVLNESIYLKKTSWGITGDHVIVTLSKSPEKNIEPDSSKEYVFLDYEIFYKVSNDSIFFYTMLKAKEPKHFYTRFIVRQIEITTSQKSDLYKTYKQQGLECITYLHNK